MRSPTLGVAAMCAAVMCLLLPLHAADSQATIIHVPGDAPTIQLAINMAGYGDEIVVGPGIYFENITVPAGWPNITIRSVSGPMQTIIDGGQIGRCITIHPNLSQIGIEGFTIRGGREAWYGGGIACFGANLHLRDNIIAGNVQYEYGGGGGGIYVDAASLPESVIERNLVVSNSGSNGAGIWTAAAILIQSNTIVGNYSPHAQSGGGGILAFSGVVQNNILAQNHADDGGGVYCYGNVSMMCNDLWANTDDETYGNCALGQGHMYEDPLFCSPGSFDYSLQGASPCVPANSPPGCGLIGALDQGCGPIAVEPSTWGAVKATYR